MKRLLALFALAAVLAGCQSPKTEPTQPTEETQPQVVSMYYAASPMERQTLGAVRSYVTGMPVGGKLLRQGEDFLLWSDGRIWKFSGENGEIRASARPTYSVELSTLRATENRIGFYSKSENSVIFLNGDLQEIGRAALPEEISETPVLSEDLETVYFILGSQIRGMDVDTGISRLIKEQNYPGQRLLNLLDSLLLCQITETDGDSYTAFLSTVSGKTKYMDEALTAFSAAGDAYFLSRGQGNAQEFLFGSTESKVPNALYPSGQDCIWLPEMECVLSVRKQADGLTMEVYNLTDGSVSARLALPGVERIGSAVAEGKRVWLLGQTEESETLYCWDTAMSAAAETAVYTSVRYTAEQPDREGLAQCRELARELSDRYGVQILFDREMLVQPETEKLIPEFQPRTIMAGLRSLEQALERLPEGFLPPLAENSGSLRIFLVREIDSGEMSTQYWRQGSACIALTVDDGMEREFYHQLCHVLDSYVIGGSRLLDFWEKENPRGFSYSYGESQEDSPYLEGDSRAFIDGLSTTFPREDRAQIFAYAMEQGNEGYFSSDAMQSKLRLLCRAIRDAYGWKQSSEVFLWEQYLNDPLAISENE